MNGRRTVYICKLVKGTFSLPYSPHATVVTHNLSSRYNSSDFGAPLSPGFTEQSQQDELIAIKAGILANFREQTIPPEFARFAAEAFPIEYTNVTMIATHIEAVLDAGIDLHIESGLARSTIAPTRNEERIRRL